MSVFNSKPPLIDKKDLILWLKNNYTFLKNKKLSLKEFNSERDKNFLLIIDTKKQFVLKISNPIESKDFLKMQDYVLSSLNNRKSIKSLIPKKIHSSIKTYKDKKLRKCFIRILEYIDGKMFAKSKQTAELEVSLGNTLGNLSNELKNIGHESSFRKFEWDPSNIHWIKKDLNLFKLLKKNIIKKNLQEFDIFFNKNKKNLRYSLTHGDPNNYNLVTSNDQIVGLLDYGDMIYAPTINDLAICLAYALMNKKDLFSSLERIISSYHNKFTISFDEIFSLMTLVKSRLTITVVMAEKQRKKFPENKYLTISQNDAWSLLFKLDKINPYTFIYLIRNICGYNIIDNYNEIIYFIKQNKFDNLFDNNLNHVNKSIIKLNSKSIFSKNKFLKTKNLTDKIKTYLLKNNSKIGIGLYGEKRNVYKSRNFYSLLNPNIKRDIHLGIDFFTSPGTNIYAPLNGKIVILKNNSQKYDYGPTIVIEHSINKNIKFYTLYGHLDVECLKKLNINQKIYKGERIGKIGNYPSNGNWPPHLHFQIIIDLMNEKENFSGVCEDFLFDMWKKISPNPNLFLKISKTFFENNKNSNFLIKKRKSLISKNFSISYIKPLQILEAKGQYMFDNKGRKYLDCVNNISHVGHCHSYIQEILIKQNSKLNTNTRYLYEIMNEYSEKLLNKFPKKFKKIFFVCTGSEANDLAYRIASNYTNSSDVIVMNNAYHGHTNTLINLSPYKFNNKGGKGKKDHVHIAEMPDGLRGNFLYKDKNWINKYIIQVQNLIEKIHTDKRKLCCFFVESILGCGGQFIFPKNYLKNVFNLIKKNNALCVVDEVQTGFARVGNNFWAFEEEGISPDIVTLGKPMGNGHPIAAVVTTNEIANSFNNGMEYFNSFGGNPVSCAVGNAVLDIIENENLQSHSYKVGKYLLNSLKSIQQKYPNKISEVRGRGLFVGIDLIDNDNFSPDKKLATKLINYMKNKGILLSTDGPYHNVIKIKPPLPFNFDDCDFLLYELNNFLNTC